MTTIALKNERRVLNFSNLAYTISLALGQELNIAFLVP